MRSTTMAVAAALSLVGCGARAMPAPVAAGTPTVSPPLTLVAQGCGRGFFRGPAGVCRPMRPVVVGPAVVVRRPAVIVRPGCGVRVGPIGVRTPC